jgi:hypothetical protein
VRKSSFTLRSLEFLKFHSSPWRPPPFLLPLLPLCCAAALPLAAVPRRPRPSLPPLASTRRPRARPPPQPFLADFPRVRHAAPPLPEPPAAACRRRPPPLLAATALLAPAPTCRPQAGRRPSSPPLAFFRQLHVASPLPELCPAATSPPLWLAPCVSPPPFFAGPKPSMLPLSPFGSVLQSHFTPSF